MNSILRNILYSGCIVMFLTGSTLSGNNTGDIGCSVGCTSCNEETPETKEPPCTSLWADWIESDWPQAEFTDDAGVVTYPDDWAVKLDESYGNFCASYGRCCPELEAGQLDAGVIPSHDAGEYRPPVYYPDAQPCDPSRPYACGHDAE